MGLFDDVLDQMESGYAKQYQNLNLRQPTSGAPLFEPVTLDETKVALKIYETGDDTDLTKILKASRIGCERYINRGFIKQTWIQTQDTVTPEYLLRRRPVLGVTSIQYITDMAADTALTLASSGYALAGERVRTRSSWPSHRGFGSWITTFTVGFADHPDAPTDEQKTAAREAVPDSIRRAIIMWAGHMYENKEGQGGESKYEAIVKAAGNMPVTVKLLLEPFLNWRLI